MDLEFFQGGGFDPNPNTFKALFVMPILGNCEREKNSGTFSALKKCLIGVHKNRGGGVKAVSTMSKYKQILLWDGFPNTN